MLPKILSAEIFYPTKFLSAEIGNSLTKITILDLFWIKSGFTSHKINFNRQMSVFVFGDRRFINTLLWSSMQKLVYRTSKRTNLKKKLHLRDEMGRYNIGERIIHMSLKTDFKKAIDCISLASVDCRDSPILPIYLYSLKFWIL